MNESPIRAFPISFTAGRRCLSGAVMALALAVAPSVVANPVVTVGGYASPVGTNIGDDLTNVSLANTFGAQFVLGPQTGTITQSYLDGIDIFWSGLPYGTMTATETALLTNWVNAGGVVIVNNDRTYTDGFRQFDDFLANFGITLLDVTSPLATLNPVGSNAIINGPFGAVSSFGLWDAAKLSTTGPANTLLTWSDDGLGAGAWVGPDAGRAGAVIVLPDWEATAVYFALDGSGQGHVLADNAWAYAAGVATGASSVPDHGSLSAFVLTLLALAAVRRRFRA